jgi:hypothetical protein
LGEKTYFFKKSSGSGSESVIQWYGSPDPDQNVTDPVYWLEAKRETEGQKQKERQWNMYHKVKTTYAYGTGTLSK